MIKEISIDNWQNFIEKQDKSNIFHHKKWIEIMIKQYGYKYKIIADLENNEIQAAIPFLTTKTIKGKKKLVSLPFTDDLEILSKSDINTKNIVEYMQKTYISCYNIEFRSNIKDVSNSKKNFGYYKHTLELDYDIDKIFRSFKKTQIQQPIDKSKRDGVYIKKYIDKEGIDLFYNLHLRVRKFHGVPVQPKGFFYRLQEKLFENNLGFTLVAFLEKKAIGASIFLNFNKQIIYKYSAADFDYRTRRPSQLMLWNAIKWGCENGYKILNMGITPKSNRGLRKFKSGWGTIEEDIAYTYLNKSDYVPLRKVGESNLLEKIITKSPLWVCRIIGELFYKFAG